MTQAALYPLWGQLGHCIIVRAMPPFPGLGSLASEHRKPLKCDFSAATVTVSPPSHFYLEMYSFPLSSWLSFP